MSYEPHPLRIQRKRTKGYKMPVSAIYAGRPTIWGNPFVGQDAVAAYEAYLRVLVLNQRGKFVYHTQGVEIGGTFFKVGVKVYPTWQVIDAMREQFSKLQGKPLACWCSLTKNCHVDPLAKLANQ